VFHKHNIKIQDHLNKFIKLEFRILLRGSLRENHGAKITNKTSLKI